MIWFSEKRKEIFMKKIKLIAASLLASTLVMSGCGNDHQHTFKEEWSHDDETHWHEATCEHTDVKGSEEAHKDENKDHSCDVCDFVMSECADSDGDHKCDICGADLPYVSSVSISGAPETLARGESVTLKVNVQAFSGASKDVTWSVDKAELASVDENGKVTALANGVVTVTATSVADSSKKGSASITIVDPDWSDDLKQAMEDSLGMVLPYFPGDFEWSEDGSSLIAESATATDTAKVIETYDALEIEKEVGEDYVEYTFPTDNEDLVVAVDVYEDEGKAYVEAYLAYKMLTEWPEEKVAAALDGYTTFEPESVPAAEGTQFGFELDTEYPNSCYVLVIGSYSSYVTKLQDLGWTVYGVDQQNMIIRMVSPLSSIVIDIQVRSSEVFVANVYAVGDPVQPAAEWPTDEVAAMLEGYTEVEIPVAEGSGFVVEALDPEEDFYYGYIQVMDGNYEDYFATLEGAGFSTPAFDAKYGCYTTFKDDLAIDIFLSGSNFYIQPYHYSAPAAEWPADEVAAYIGEHGDETIPAAVGTSFTTDVKTYPYNALLIDVTGDVSAYIAQLQGAEWEIADLTASSGYYFCTSPKGYLQLAIFPDEGEFEIQLMLANPPVVEWPAEQIAAYIGEYTDETVPAAEGTAFSTSEKTSPYSALVIDVTGDVSAYLSVLEGAEWQINDLTASYGYYDCYSPEHYLELAIFPDEGEFEIQLMLSEPPAPEFPAEALAEFIGDYTTDTVPSPTGTGFENGISKGVFWANITGGNVSEYLETLQLAGYVLHENVDLGTGGYTLTSESGALQLAIFDSGTSFELDVYKVVAPELDEFPADNLAAFLSESTAETVPAPLADGFDDKGLIESLTSSYYEIIARYGDCYTYAYSLYLAGWSVNTSYYSSYGMIRATSPLGTIQLQLWDNTFSFDIDVYIIGETSSEFPSANVASFIGDYSETTVPAAVGTLFNDEGLYEGTYYVLVEGSVDDYISALGAANFEFSETDYNGKHYVSSDNLVDVCLYSYSESVFEIGVSLLVPPSVEWPTDLIAAQVLGLGASGTVLPFTSENVTSYTVQAAGSGFGPVINVSVPVTKITDEVAAYIAQLEGAGYVLVGTNYESPVYAKEGESLGISPYKYGNEFYIELLKVTPVYYSWQSTLVSEALGDGTEESGDIPAANGTKFQYSVNPDGGEVIAKVYGNATNFAEYKTALELAGFNVVDDAYGFTATSSGKTIVIYASDYTDNTNPYFTLDFCVHEAPSAEFPSDMIAEYIGEGKLYPIPDGSSYAGSDYCGIEYQVQIEGGDKTAYISALTGAGFVYNEDYSWEPNYSAYVDPTGTFCVYVYGGDSNATYVIGFGLYYPM